MILNKKIFLFLVFTFFIFGSFIIKAQSEKKDKTILIPSESSPSLLNPKKNMSLNFKLNDLSPNTNKTPEINMMDQEDFIDPSEYYTARMNKKKGEKSKNSNLLKKDIYLGDFKTSDENINVVFRDHEYPDGDIIQIKVNDKVVINSIILQEQFRGINIELENGFNRIDFIALNQGESGPNTAELKV